MGIAIAVWLAVSVVTNGDGVVLKPVPDTVNVTEPACTPVIGTLSVPDEGVPTTNVPATEMLAQSNVLDGHTFIGN